MNEQRPDFLPRIIEILDRLQATTLQNNEPMLASLLEIARVEAEDAYRHALAMAAFDTAREATSSTHTWRACDRRGDDSIAA